MWTFEDKGGRPCCLVPEATRALEEMWLTDWSKREKSLKCFYVARCYRYDRPQKGRYREFTQIGVEWFGKSVDMVALKQTAQNLLSSFSSNFVFKDGVERGLSYYEEGLGFEIEAPWLGAQKQCLEEDGFLRGLGLPSVLKDCVWRSLRKRSKINVSLIARPILITAREIL